MRERFVLLLTFGLIFFLVDLGMVFAQESDTEEFTLEEITVTAQKREENQQKVPIAMEVISGEQMRELGHTNVEDILASVGNVVINKASDGYRVALRGVTDDFGVFNGQTTSTPTVAISADGVYSSRNDSGSNLYDVERMEVLFGPQSTMYANTSPGGIINVVTASPKTDKFAVTGTIEYGNFNTLHTEGAVNAPINEKMALRASFYTSKHDGYLDNGGEDEDNKSARIKALYQPNDMLSFTLTGQIFKQGGHSFAANVEAFDKESDVSDPWTAVNDLGDPSDQTQKSTNANITWDTGFGTMTLVPSYTKTSSSQIETSNAPGSTVATVNHLDFDQTEKSGEVRMTSASDFLFKWIAGFNYYKSENARLQTTEGSVNTQYTGFWNDQKALYANITYPITDVFRLTGGGRKNWAKMTTHGESLNSATSSIQGPQTGKSEVTQNADGTYDIITDNIQEYPNSDYKFGMEYDLGESSMLYADVSTSFRMQGQGMANAKGEYPPPEEMTAYTIGAKNRFFGNKLQVNVSAYLYNYKNKYASGNPTWFIYMWEDDERILNAVDPDTGEALNYTFVDNNGVTQYGIDLNGNGELNNEDNPGDRGQSSLADSNRANWGNYRNIGLDIQMSWMISTKDRLDISYSYMQNEWTELIYYYEYDWIYPMVDYSGKSNVNSPEHNITLTYNHYFPLWNGGTLTSRVETRYQSEYFVSFKEYDSPYRDQEAHHITNLSLIYASPSGHWTLTGWVKNLENYAVKQGLFSTGESATGMNYEMMVGNPRTYGAVLSVSF